MQGMAKKEHKAIEDFHLELEWPVYAPGATIQGRVLLTLREKLLCDTVSARFMGISKVFWVEREVQGPEGVQSVPYSAERIHFDQTLSLWNPFAESAPRREEEEKKEKTEEELEKELKELVENSRGLRLRMGDTKTPAPAQPHSAFLAQGPHEFYFSFTLPHDIPTSFQGAKEVSEPTGLARVRYTVAVTLMEKAFVKGSRKEELCVVRPVDLSLSPAAGQPLIRQATPPPCSPLYPGGLLCCVSPTGRKNGAIHMMATLQKTGYLPAERILISAEIDNLGRRSRVVKLKAKLLQNLICQSTKPFPKIRETSYPLVTVSKKIKIGGGQAWLWDGEPPMYVPAAVPGFLEAGVVEVEYSLSVQLYRRRSSKSRSDGRPRTPLLSLDFPLLIGTLPVTHQAPPPPPPHIN